MSPRALAGFASVVFMSGMIPVTFAVTTGSGSTGSGAAQTSSASSENDLQRGDREKRTQGFRDKVLQSQKKEKTYRDAFLQYLKKQTKLRSDCRMEIRKANRDSKMIVVLRCERADAMEKKELIRKQSTYITDTPGVSPLIRANVRSRLDALLDALTAIVDAIDNGVYASVDDLLETRQNLRERYGSPVFEALSLLRADRALTWIGLMIKDIDAVTPGMDATASGSTLPQWNTGRRCLIEQEKQLQAFIDSEPAERTVPLQKILTSASSCMESLLLIPDAKKLETGSGSEK